MRTLRLAMAQVNPTVGDLPGNARLIAGAIGRARDQGADIVAFPEMVLPGYPVEDLVLKPQFIDDNVAQLHALLPECRGITAVIGFIDRDRDIYNAAAVIHDGALAGIYHKQFLPNYGVFDEQRYFQAGTETPLYIIDGVGVGVTVCEDIWYPGGPAAGQALAGADLIININGSPYHAGKWRFREQMVATRAADYGAIVSYVNLVGGQDELVFDGGSFVYDEKGELVVRGTRFQEDLVIADLDIEGVFRSRLHEPRRREDRRGIQAAGEVKVITVSTNGFDGEPGERRGALHAPGGVAAQEDVGRGLVPRQKQPLAPRPRIADPSLEEEVYQALVLGLRDYVQKSGFNKVVLGLSGGIDSSLVAALAVAALGKENVAGVAMPSRYSSEGSIIDAKLLAGNLGIDFKVLPIEGAFTAFLDTLQDSFAGTAPNVAEENMQARVRGVLLMALSNKFGWLVLTTGNKSETATGYSTLYGDMAGGFAVIKDVPKTLVYQVSHYINQAAGQALIPESVMTKVPSAELRPNQTDQDTLPPYDLLDQALQAYVEEDWSYQEMLERGLSEAVVQQVIRLVDGSEYKRRQGPPGIKITPRAFGRDRRLPLVNRYRSF